MIGHVAAGLLAVSACATSGLALSGCGGSGGQSPSASRPASPINLAVYVNDRRVSVSPRSVGAGLVVFVVTNQASHAESLAISRTGASAALASTAPINPQGTTQLSVDFTPGDYTIATASRGRTQAQRSEPSSIRPASLHIGRERPNSDNQVLQP
ncbi:MAG: hypothetical protein ACRDNJ_07310 [Solirubrobacteraceae bacterium]